MVSQTDKALIFFTVIGALSLLATIYNLARFIALYLRFSSIKKYNKNGGAWALVTGSSDGIGEAMAHELCSRGFNIILHGRNPTKLSSVKSKLATAFPKTQFRTFVADAMASTETNSVAIQDLVASVKDLNLTVLVNNVGGAANMRKAFTTFEEHTAKEIDDLISINMLFTLHLTHALLPILARQEAALIMNTGSSSQFGMVYLSAYSPTKAYLSSWGNALSTEMQAENLNIEVMTVVSGNTQTGQDSRAANIFRPTARTFAKAAVAKVGCGNTVVVAHFWHGLEAAVIGSLPQWAQRMAIIAAIKPYKGKNLDD